MRLRTVTALMTLVAVSTAGCSSTPTEAAPTQAAPTATVAPPGSKDEICTVWTRKLFGDPGESAVRYFDNLQNSPTQYPVRRRIAIRQAYYALQEREMRKLAATATDPALQAALRAVADGSAELGRDTTPDGPPVGVPDMSAVYKVCGGRIIGVPSTR